LPAQRILGEVVRHELRDIEDNSACTTDYNRNFGSKALQRTANRRPAAPPQRQDALLPHLQRDYNQSSVRNISCRTTLVSALPTHV
jgi:hypothetical protein